MIFIHFVSVCSLCCQLTNPLHHAFWNSSVSVINCDNVDSCKACNLSHYSSHNVRIAAGHDVV